MKKDVVSNWKKLQSADRPRSCGCHAALLTFRELNSGGSGDRTRIGETDSGGVQTGFKTEPSAKGSNGALEGGHEALAHDPCMA
ncbi:hypothetical protein P3T25_006919 [Paraburkholderia sp. GAS32]